MLIATDPDADRLGAAVRLPDGSYEVLTGNQIGALFAQYILEAHQSRGTLPENAAVLKSIVSSELPTAIAEHYGATMFNVLTGFKFIAEKNPTIRRRPFTYFYVWIRRKLWLFS